MLAIMGRNPGDLIWSFVLGVCGFREKGLGFKIWGSGFRAEFGDRGIFAQRWIGSGHLYQSESSSRKQHLGTNEKDKRSLQQQLWARGVSKHKAVA